jgi:hypothetical protein
VLLILLTFRRFYSKSNSRAIDERTIDQILRDQDAEGQIERNYEKLKPTLDAETPLLRNEVKDKLEQDQAKSWRQPVADKAANAVESSL